MTINEKKVLAIIPARGGSKGLPRKNILNMCGKPLIGWSIEQAKNSTYVDRVIVSTDDKEIAEIAKKYGAEVPFLRPKEYATDTVSPTDAILHVIYELEKTGYLPDIVIQMQPTCCIREPEDIDDALRVLISNKTAKSIVSLIKIENTSHPDFVVKLDNNGFIGGKLGDSFRRQNLSDRYAYNGTILASYTSSLKKFKSFNNEFTLGYVITQKYKTLDINDNWDFIQTEAVLNYLLEKNLLKLVK
ncbi:MAG: acylneuraminate cytidylyltransferase family protein [archaeon]